MKKLIFIWLLSVLFLSATNAQQGTERSGYEGDNFSLQGAVDLFKASNSVEDFERKLNTEDRWVNNLDLNYDGQIDYIRVDHRKQGDYHAIILQVPINRYDIQDVAVIEIEQTGRRDAMLQIVGDVDLYGEEVIVEPIEGNGYSSSRGGSNPEYNYDNQFAPDYVNVYYWPAVQDIVAPDYVVYTSPYRWSYYPRWWNPWNQFAWHLFHPRVVIYHSHYHVVRYHRLVHVHHFYRPYRSYSYRVLNNCNRVRVRHGHPAKHRTYASQNHGRVRQGGKVRQLTKTPHRAARNNIATKRSQSDKRNKTSNRRSLKSDSDRNITANTRTNRANSGRSISDDSGIRKGNSDRNISSRVNSRNGNSDRNVSSKGSSNKGNSNRNISSRGSSNKGSSDRNVSSKGSSKKGSSTRSSSSGNNSRKSSSTKSSSGKNKSSSAGGKDASSSRKSSKSKSSRKSKYKN